MADLNLIELQIFLTPERAHALTSFLKRVDDDALERYTDPADKGHTSGAFVELREALAEVWVKPKVV